MNDQRFDARFRIRPAFPTLFERHAEAHGYPPGELVVECAEHDHLLGPEIRFTRGAKSMVLYVPIDVMRNVTSVVEWTYERFVRDVLPMLARAPSPRFRIATRGARRLQFDARTL